MKKARVALILLLCIMLVAGVSCEGETEITPTPTPTLENHTTEVGGAMVAAGYSHTIRLKSDGTVVAVGDNEYGQCDVSGWSDIQQVSAGGRSRELDSRGAAVFYILFRPTCQIQRESLDTSYNHENHQLFCDYWRKASLSV